MSLTYTTLKAQIALYLKRPDLTSMIPSFITRGENELNRRLNVVQREVRFHVDLVAGDRTTDVSVPSEDTFVFQALMVWRSATAPLFPDSGSPTKLVFRNSQQFIEVMSESAGPPNFYTLEATGTLSEPGELTLRVERPADQNYSLGMVMRALFDIVLNQDNWLVTRHEEAYLFAALVQAEPFIKNDKRIIVWRSMLEAVIQQINDEDRISRGTQNTTMVSELAQQLPARGPFNINEG